MQALQSHLKNGWQTLPQQPDFDQCSARVTSVLAMNPSSYALRGTNCYLIGTGRSRILLDTGEGRAGFILNLKKAMSRIHCSLIKQVLISHAHADHVGGIKDVLREFGPMPVRKLLPPRTHDRRFGVFQTPEDAVDPRSFESSHVIDVLQDNEQIQMEGATLEAIHTPGHSEDHLCFFLHEEKALFTGDNVLGIGTVIVTDLAEYLNSLRKMIELNPSVLYPAHGPPIQGKQAVARLVEYVEHRLIRLQSIRTVLQSYDQSLDRIAQATYGGNFPKDRYLQHAARVNTETALRKLEDDGEATKTPAGSWLRGSRIRSAEDSGIDSEIPHELKNDKLMKEWKNNIEGDMSSVAPEAKQPISADVLYLVEQGVSFRRKGQSTGPTGDLLMKKQATGSQIECTGRTWRGPQGGLWAELFSGRGWTLIEGPGFGVEGPVLRRVCSDENVCVIRVLPPQSEKSFGSSEDLVLQVLCELLVGENDTFMDVMQRVKQRAGIEVSDLVGLKPAAVLMGASTAAMLREPEQWLLRKSDLLQAEGFKHGDELYLMQCESQVTF